jgi:hypothetical protein
MKDLYPWHFPLSKEEISDAWEHGTLSVDTNVLLDLYRYHEGTRTLLLSALALFRERAWLSHQAAEEFFRSRNSVIVSASSGFDSVTKTASEILARTCEDIQSLGKNRIIPNEMLANLSVSVSAAFNGFHDDLSKAEESFPSIANDTVIERLSDLFNGRVGSPYEEVEYNERIKEAKIRFANEVPPGFKDSASKKGDRQFGDFLLWRQLLDYADQHKKPLIFVTSEQKEDWWERASGKTIGPRQELLREYFKTTGKRLLFYQTDRFLEFASKKIGQADVAEAVEEIRDVAMRDSGSNPLVKIREQSAEIASSKWHKGVLVVKLLRPAFKFTCSGRFDPRMSSIPELTIGLRSSPSGIPPHILRFGTGTTYDFNIHLKSTDYGEYLPSGSYTFLYEATSYSSPQSEGDI